MAAPNIVNVANIFAKTFANVVTTSNAIVIANGSNSGNVLKINTIILSNVDGTYAASANVEYNSAAAGTGTPYRLARTVSVPPNSSLIVVDKSTAFYMEENTSIKTQASANSNLEIIVSYEVLS
jgi:hypothetical protein